MCFSCAMSNNNDEDRHRDAYSTPADYPGLGGSPLSGPTRDQGAGREEKPRYLFWLALLPVLVAAGGALYAILR
jgi:hypothetical protein